jgi:hypothetical protein
VAVDASLLSTTVGDRGKREDEMRKTDLVSILAAAALACACEQAVEPAPSAATAEEASEASYSPIPIDAADEPGTPRQVRCQIGSEAAQTCTLTPLFGDDSFQLDGAGVALRMVVTGNEGGLFEVRRRAARAHRRRLSSIFAIRPLLGGRARGCGSVANLR